MPRFDLFDRICVSFQKWFHRTGSCDPHDETPEEILTVRRQASEQNRASTPREDESITLRCLWAVEFYTPSHMDGLLNDLRKLGWLGERDIFEPEDPASWLFKSRRYGDGGWKTLGYIVNQRSNAADLTGLKRTAPLPGVSGILCA